MTNEDLASDLADVRRESLERGYVEGLDFFVMGFHTTFSSEMVLLVVEENGLQVRYRDMGEETLLAAGARVVDIRDEYFAALRRLGRGRELEPARSTEPVAPKSDDELMADFLRAFPNTRIPEGD